MDALIEERLSQLEEISKRRNALLVAMHALLKRRENLAALSLEDEEEDHEGLDEFLSRFDLQNHSAESIMDLEIELLAPPEPSSDMEVDDEPAVALASPHDVEDELAHATREPTPADEMKESSLQPVMHISPAPPSRSPTPLPQTPPAHEETVFQDGKLMHAWLPPSTEDDQKRSVDAMDTGETGPGVGHPFFIPTPSTPARELPDFVFDPDADKLVGTSPSRKTVNPADTLLSSTAKYSLPPLKALPLEFVRKAKPAKSRKREKDKERLGSAYSDGRKDKEEWMPMGLHRWGATIRANPTWKRVARATKCLDTRQWLIATQELTLIRTLDRIETLKDAGRWSFRQPKKHKPIGYQTKTHWDYLMEEMKWMRIDFREERKWKLSLAYALAHEAVQWHEAGNLAERVKQGICVPRKWPRAELEEEQGEGVVDVDHEDEHARTVMDTPAPLADEGSDDSDDEQDREQQDVLDALNTTADVDYALQQAADITEHAQQKEPKLEDVDHSSALQNAGSNAPVTDSNITSAGSAETPQGENVAVTVYTQALKQESSNPILGTSAPQDVGADTPAADQKPHIKSNVYAPLREKIALLGEQSLFLDWDALDLPSLASAVGELEPIPAPADLSYIFPELTVLGIPDVTTNLLVGEIKKKNGKSDNRRVEEALATKLVPIGQFMNVKPTLIGALEPSKHWYDGEWHDLDDSAVVVEYEGPLTKAIEESGCGLFDGNKPNAGPLVTPSALPQAPKDPRRRVSDNPWSPEDDMLLRSLIERFPNNWRLIADSFNSMRYSIPTDRRTAWECFDRWSTQIVGNRGTPAGEDTRSVPPTPTTATMTTRGVKRQATASLAANGAPSGSPAPGLESKKRRRHNLMHDAIRKAVKKRESAAKAQAQRKTTAATHDTHAQYNKMPRLTPIDLSRMKQEKEARDQQEQMRQRRQLNDQYIMKHALQAQYRMNGMQGMAAMQQAQALQQQQQQAQAQGQQQPVATTRSAANGIPVAQGVPQIRAQVNISGQQRTSTPMTPSNTRMSPQQIIQAQAQAQAHARALAAAQANPPQTHLSPQFAPRGASSSPAVPHGSPVAAAAAVATSPRPTAPQAYPNIPPATPVVASGPRIPFYQVPGAPAQFTPEQVEQAIRMHNMLQQQQQRNMTQNTGS